MAYTLSKDDLIHNLEAVCDRLIKQNVIQENQKTTLVENLAESLIKTYDNDVPQNLFTDPEKLKALRISLISFSLSEKNPALKLDPMKLFEPDLKPEEKKSFLKNFILKLKPKNKKSSEDELEKIEKLLDNLIINQTEKEITQKKQEKGEEKDSNALTNSKSAVDLLEEVYEILYGQNYFGQVTLTSTAGQNAIGVVDDKPVTSWLQGIYGVLHKGRDLTSIGTNPDIENAAEKRLLSLGGLNPEELAHIKLHQPSSPSPFKKQLG